MTSAKDILLGIYLVLVKRVLQIKTYDLTWEDHLWYFLADYGTQILNDNLMERYKITTSQSV